MATCRLSFCLRRLRHFYVESCRFASSQPTFGVCFVAVIFMSKTATTKTASTKPVATPAADAGVVSDVKTAPLHAAVYKTKEEDRDPAAPHSRLVYDAAQQISALLMKLNSDATKGGCEECQKALEELTDSIYNGSGAMQDYG